MRPVLVTEVPTRSLIARADAGFVLTGAEYERYYGDPVFPLVSLGDVVELVQYGSSKRASVDTIGVPILRMSNLQQDDWDLNDLKFVDLTPAELETYRLHTGDVLFTRTNGSPELVGKCAVFREEGDWVFASYLIRVRVDRSRLLPEFLSAFLNTRPGRLQVTRLSRQILMSNINAEEIRSIQVPLPPIPTQAALLEELLGVDVERRKLRALGDASLRALNASVMQMAGVAFHGEGVRRRYDIATSSLIGTRLDVSYHQPDRRAAREAVEQSGRSSDLGEIVAVVGDRVEAPNPASYVGLASVSVDTGELVSVAQEAEVGSGLRFQAGDVLFSRLRPYLNKVWLANTDGTCSTEFRVLRSEAGVTSEYLAAILRAPVVVSQAIFAAAGNTHPRLPDADLKRLRIPVPGIDAQREITAVLRKERTDAEAVRARSTDIWEIAKDDFVRALLRFEGVVGGDG